jgi:hypothetical protein
MWLKRLKKREKISEKHVFQVRWFLTREVENENEEEKRRDEDNRL